MTDDRLPWFPCEPSKLLGALSSMKPHVAYTYWMVCLRIYEVCGPCTDGLDVIVRRTGYNKRVVSDALDVLFRAEKLVRTPEGIVNPYATDVLAGMKARRGRLSQSGREGARRKWKKHKRDQGNVDGEAIPAPLLFDAESESQLESEGKKEERTKSPAAPDDWPKDFEELFWAKYPIKKGKRAALAKLVALRRSGTVSWATLISGVDRMIAARLDPRYTKHPTTWLNQGCWDDEYAAPGTTQHGGPPQGSGSRGRQSFGDIAMAGVRELKGENHDG